jgi:excisionase family DNA binding protein
LAKRKAVITIETHSLTILQKRTRSFLLRCAVCEAETQMVTVEQAARVLSVTQRTIFRLVESDRLHFAETPEGQLLICVESL